jgi:hypothetical protein
MILLEARRRGPPESGLETCGSGVPIPKKPPELPADAAKPLPHTEE